MRIRSLATGLAMSFLLAGAVLRCAIPDPPPGPQPFATKVRLARGAFLSLPSGTLDKTALIASLREMSFTTIILQTSATESGQRVAERVALAVELQRELDADVFIGGYQAATLNGNVMDALLAKDPAFASCYPPDGPHLDADAALIDKLRVCSQDVGAKLAAELARVNASPRIGCYVAHQPALTATPTAEARTKLHDFFHDAASACVLAKRTVAISPVLPSGAGDAVNASFVLRDALQDSGIRLVILQDGVGTFATPDASAPSRAAPYYRELHVALYDQPDAASVQIWGNLEAFECDGPGCAQQHPTTTTRFIDQLCGARGRVDGIVATEYLHDLAERPLVTGDLDASADLRAIAQDTDAAAQLHRGYLEWVDAGASCAPR